jgi:hypothetical protein
MKGVVILVLLVTASSADFMDVQLLSEENIMNSLYFDDLVFEYAILWEEGDIMEVNSILQFTQPSGQLCQMKYTISKAVEKIKKMMPTFKEHLEKAAKYGEIELDDKTISSLYPVEFHINGGDFVADRLFMVANRQEGHFKFLPFGMGEILDVVRLVRTLPNRREENFIHQTRMKKPFVFDVQVTRHCIAERMLNETGKVAVDKMGYLGYVLGFAAFEVFLHMEKGMHIITTLDDAREACVGISDSGDAPFTMESCCHVQKIALNEHYSKLVCHDTQIMRKIICKIIRILVWLSILFFSLTVIWLPHRQKKRLVQSTFIHSFIHCINVYRVMK